MFMKAHIRYDDIKLKTVPMMLDNRTYNIAMTLNAIEKIQEEYGSLEDAMDKLSDMAIPVIKKLSARLEEASVNHQRLLGERAGYLKIIEMLDCTTKEGECNDNKD